MNRTPDRNSQPQLGDADAVQKTSYLSDVHGTDATDRDRSPVGLSATVRHRGGLGAFGWIVLVLAALVIAAYAAGLFT